jgi:hypothetical protein
MVKRQITDEERRQTPLTDCVRDRDRLAVMLERIANIVAVDPDTNPQVRRIAEVLDEDTE